MKVTLKELTKVFPASARKNRDVVAVNNFDLTIPDGTLVGLLGPSGCGKSTALNLLSGLLRPTRGRIFFGDEDVTDLPPEKRGVGMVFQNYALYPHLNVLQNIIFPLQNRKGKDKLTPAQMKEKAYEVARLVLIDELMDRKPRALSGGQQQRVAIARALVKEPRILLLDEPLSNLDARLRLQTREEIRRIQRATGVTTVFVTHDQEEAMSISDQIIVMKDGVIQQIGKPQEVYDDPANLFVASFLGTPPIHKFTGEVREGTLYLADAPVLPAAGVPDGKVDVGIRPEGFAPDPAGALRALIDRVEVMGRDVTLVCRHPACSKEIRAIVNADDARIEPGEAAFSLKPHKVLLFDPESGARIRPEVEHGTK